MTMIPVLKTMVPRWRAKLKTKQTHTEECGTCCDEEPEDECSCEMCKEHEDREVHNARSNSRGRA